MLVLPDLSRGRDPRRGGLEFFYDMAFTAALVAVLKFYKLGKPDGFVGSLIRFYMSSNIYHVHYRQENKSVDIRFKL